MCSAKPTQSYQQFSSTELFSIFQLIVSVFWAATPLFWFSLTALICHFQTQHIAVKESDIPLRSRAKRRVIIGLTFVRWPKKPDSK